MISHIGLGIDAGGTKTRWALSDANEKIIAEGAAAGMTALQMATEHGRAHMRETLGAIARDLPAASKPAKICAGMTGYSEGGDTIRAFVATVFGLNADVVALHSDIEIACLDLFAPGEGYVIYAGTGSIAAFIDADNRTHRAGGHGVILDDAGGGYWIAVEALRQIWRAEDAHPESWIQSPMALEMFKRIGGSDWPSTRTFVYQKERGEIGALALAVAAAAEQDPTAMEILRRAGIELARLANAMIARFGMRPIALAGRVAQLHPIIEKTLRAELPAGIDFTVRSSDAHIAAAHIAARANTRNPRSLAGEGTR